MASFTVPNTAFQANVEFQSPPQLVNQTIRAVAAVFSDPGGQWPATPDPTRHIKCWGLQLNRPGGGDADWRWYLFSGNTHDSSILNDGAAAPMPDDPAMWLAFGTRTKNGGLPFLSLESSAVREATGCRIRLAVLTDAALTLGATITAT